MDSSLAIDATPIWSGVVDCPNDVLHNILTHNLEEMEIYAEIEDGKEKLVQLEDNISMDADLSPKEIKSIKAARRRKKYGTKEASLPARTQLKRNIVNQKAN